MGTAIAFPVGARVINRRGETGTVTVSDRCPAGATPVEYDIDDNGQVWNTPTYRLRLAEEQPL